MHSFGTRLAHARRVRRVTQSALAREASIPGDSMISRYERDIVAPHAETIARLADALGVPFEWLAIGRGTAPALGDVECESMSGSADHASDERKPSSPEAAAE